MVKKLIMEITTNDLMKKLDIIHDDIQSVKLQVAVTNGKVKLHEKLLYAIGSSLVLIVSWIIYSIELKGGN